MTNFFWRNRDNLDDSQEGIAGLPALHIFRWKIEQLYLQICGFIREDRYADPYGTKKRTFSLRLFRFAGHFSNRMVYHAGYSDV